MSNVAIRPNKPFIDLTLEDWKEVQGIILDGAFFLTKAVVPSMIQQGYGRIIYISGDGA